MNKHYKYTTIILSLLSGSLLFSCSNLNDPGNCSECEETPAAAPYTVGFTLGGSVGEASRAAEIKQSEAEKKLTSLYAVVFTDADGSGNNGDTDKVDENDLFFAAFPVDLTGYNSDDGLSDPNLKFSLGEQGKYNICFIANPSGHKEGGQGLTGLADKIMKLQKGVSKVSDFKALMEETEANLSSSLLMTSPFYFVTTSYTQESVIPTVTMTRAVARIDVVNKADGIIIKRLIFNNYGLKSRLITDDPKFTEGTVGEKVFIPENGGLVGDSEASVPDGSNEYKEKIYSYEQYAGTEAGGSSPTEEHRPSLEIVYSVPSHDPDALFSHTVKFENTTQEPKVTAVPLKRNNHYRIMVGNSNNKIEFTLSVKDWDKGEEFKLEGSDFAENATTPVE